MRTREVSSFTVSNICGIMAQYKERTVNINLPLIRKRRIYPGLIASDIVGVQPMSGPTGSIFNMKNPYSKSMTMEEFHTQLHILRGRGYDKEVQWTPYGKYGFDNDIDDKLAEGV